MMVVGSGAQWVVGKAEQEVVGTVKDGKVSWLAKDVRNIEGNGNAGDNHGSLGSDKNGDKIDFVYRVEGGGSGSYTLRLKKLK